VAIANYLCKYYSTNIIFLKGIKKDYQLELDKKINVYCFAKDNYFTKLLKARRLIENYKNGKSIILSMCLSADIFSVLLKNNSYKISSIRGNLIKNYYYSYSFIGIILALFHMFIQNLLDLTLVMHNQMLKQVKTFSKTKIISINNFIEESKLFGFFKKKINFSKRISFVFVGGLNNRKDPLSLIKAFEKICFKNDFLLHIIGNGPLKKKIYHYINKKNLNNHVILHGFLKSPYSVVSESDVFVLPSYSEGTPRAAMEALFLGVPCVLRDVEGNSELIDKELKNGELFRFNDELPDILLKISYRSRKRLFRKIFCPKNSLSI